MAAPLTSLEIDGTSTTLEEEEALLAQIAAETSATVTVAGHSVGGLPIRCVSLGNVNGPALLVVTGQHGTEIWSREGVFQFLRDVAYSEDPAVLAALEHHRVVIIPTVNPDGRGTTYNNANNVNINRDYVSLTQPESRAVMSVVTAVRPLVTYDAHEATTDAATWLHVASVRPGTYPGITAASEALVNTIGGKITADGWTVTQYPLNNYAWASVGNTCAGMHGVGLLGETAGSWPGSDRYVRAWCHRTAAHTALLWLHENATQLGEARAAGVQDAVASKAPVAIPDRAVTGASGTSVTPYKSASVAGYTLAQPIPPHLLEAHGIVASDTFVSVQQEARAAVVALCDPESVYKAVSAARVPWPEGGDGGWTPPPPPTGVPAGVSAQIGGMRRPVLGVYRRVDAASLPARLTP